ncbi:sulfite exporter TauE/SafE family protein [Pseudomonas sp. Fig-3]|uniref:urease accessory protein UreH domain-containing protein n=1 Tax=unclassified Pseudomonas TaxID=196821 RepID=UPI0011128F2C|nr:MULTISPECIES: cytochrome c biogenesis protein CcdA [unclassified Pseudomonas]TNB81442.1 sulfite exporter TauE/SafE family protein [Pseudomonas sp. Fig-3]
MDAISLTNLILIPLGLGLLGFIEPCTIGVSLWAVKYLEGESGWSKARHMLIFSLTRALLIGMLGVVAALLGSSFFIFQQGMWLILGLVYGGLGLLYLSGRSGWLSRRLGPSLNAVPHSRGSVFLGLVLGLNIPACAAPLLFALIATTATSAQTWVQGFISMALFGLALSVPLVLAVLLPQGRRLLDRLAGLSSRAPRWTGFLLLGLAAWSIYFGLTVDIEQWR